MKHQKESQQTKAYRYQRESHCLAIELAFHLDAMMQHKGWRAIGWGVVRHDFSEPISYDFSFHLVCHVTQDSGSELAKWGALTFGIRTMKVWLRLSLSSHHLQRGIAMLLTSFVQMCFLPQPVVKPEFSQDNSFPGPPLGVGLRQQEEWGKDSGITMAKIESSGKESPEGDLVEFFVHDTKTKKWVPP